MPTTLGIESTCDETGAAVVVDGHDVRSNVIASQVELHARYRGVVPEIASRAHIENILPVVHDAIEQAKLSLGGVDAIAVAHRPGLIGSLLIGVTAAKSLAWSIGKPLIGVDHVHAHLYSVLLDRREPIAPQWTERSTEPSGSAAGSSAAGSSDSGVQPIDFPAVGLVVSGGHTALYRIASWTDVTLIGSTIDDAVGEAYDKVSAILGLGYPGGPVLDRLAPNGDPTALNLPRSLLGRDSLDFSFSGLKTSVLYAVRGVPGKHQSPPPALDERRINDIAASFQAACVDTIITKLKRAIAQTSAKSIIIGGGVSANRGLREATQRLPLPVHLPPLEYCTDNAAISAGLADVYFRQQKFSPLELDAVTYSRFRN
jgi:N6-L-threonylcarbamoyladenine synthase